MIEAVWYILIGAFVLDVLLGDPMPHPVVWMGNAVSFFEAPFRRLVRNEFVAGLLFALSLIFGTYIVSLGVVWVAGLIHPILGIGIQILLLFYCFSVKTLVTAAMDVARPLTAGDLTLARRKVAMIVGRETQNLDDPGVTRAAVETVAENFVDGFLSPLFWALLLGVPGALAYKMVNTLDSMVGYRNDTYLLFGRAAARIDDGANLIPARLSVPVIALAAGLLSRQRGMRALKTALSDCRNHKSPNAGFPEAGFAGALGIRMGGPNIYHGKLVDKPYIGEGFGDPDTGTIARACDLMQLSALVGLVAAIPAAWIFWGAGG